MMGHAEYPAEEHPENWWNPPAEFVREGRRAWYRRTGIGHWKARQEDFAVALGVNRRTIIRAEQRGINFFKSSIALDKWVELTGLDPRISHDPSKAKAKPPAPARSSRVTRGLGRKRVTKRRGRKRGKR